MKIFTCLKNIITVVFMVLCIPALAAMEPKKPAPISAVNFRLLENDYDEEVDLLRDQDEEGDYEGDYDYEGDDDCDAEVAKLTEEFYGCARDGDEAENAGGEDGRENTE